MDNLLVDYMDDPEFAHRPGRIAVDYKSRIMDRALEMGADVALTRDDYAHPHGASCRRRSSVSTSGRI